MSYLVSAISFVPVIVMFTGLKEAPWQLAVPGAGPAIGARAA